MCRMSAPFDLKLFLDSPSFEAIEQCRKAELIIIADHFKLPILRSMLKKDIRNVLLERLVELGVLTVQATVHTTSGVVLPELGASLEQAESTDGPVETDGRDALASDEPEVRTTLPRFDPLSPMSVESPQSLVEDQVDLSLARLQLEARERAEALRIEFQFKLAVRKMEVDSDRDIRMRELELKAQELALLQQRQLVTPTCFNPPSLPVEPQSGDHALAIDASLPAVSNTSTFDINKHIALVPPFRESEVDTYFQVFERLATTLQWPREIWTLLLQCKLVGKAQEVCSSLSLNESLQYNVVKAAILRAYELVPEAYRQRFRSLKKAPGQTHVEFMREKSTLFDKWCSATKVTDFESLRELILLEEFRNCVPDRVVVYLHERTVSTVSQAAVFADEFVLTHKQVFKPASENSFDSKAKYKGRSRSPPQALETRECYYCHKPGHIAVNCLVLKKKQQKQSDQNVGPVSQSKGVALAGPVIPEVSSFVSSEEPVLDPCYQPFVSKGRVCLVGVEEHTPVKILRDTGAAQSFILADVLPFSNQSFCGSHAICQGLGMGYLKAPLHMVQLSTDLLSGQFKVAVCDNLPVKGVNFILGNDIAGGKVMPVLEVVDVPDSSLMVDEINDLSKLFPACVCTRAQSRKLTDVVDLSDSFLYTDQMPSNSLSPVIIDSSKKEDHMGQGDLNDGKQLECLVGQAQLVAAQKADPSLQKYFTFLSSKEGTPDSQVGYCLENEVLMRKWCPRNEPELRSAYQIVVPTAYRQHVLSLAHDSPWSGHLGITKTYNRILKHFFWPALKKDVSNHCRSCHVCQSTGKPNQKIPPAPLQPIPVLGEPFDRVLVDCVGPLPKSKLGNQFLLTIMCAATRFPEAIPLRRITAPAVTRALIKFFSTFGLPKVIQTDQGTNFLSKLFAQIMKTLNIKHVVSSCYHPESQGALERFHQSLKSMLRKYCQETGKAWDEGVPFVLFAVREAVQESLSFSPAELVFGHSVRGPLKLLKESFMSNGDQKPVPVLDYVSNFRERLHEAWKVAKETLALSQTKMKETFDKRALSRNFSPGDKVLVLLPVPGSSLAARFSGPYVVERKLSDTDYVIKTPERRKSTRVCHINMLKAYHSRDVPVGVISSPVPVGVVATLPEVTTTEDVDGLHFRGQSLPTARLANSEALLELSSQLSHLTEEQQKDLIKLINDFPSLFTDVPSQTSVLKHNIKVTTSVPIKQHPYRTNATKRALMKQEVDYLLEHGFAKPSVSPWSSPCLLVPKPDGTFRFCTDYRKVNSVTVPDSYPLPRMDDCVDSIGAARFVSKLDLLKGYWQVPLTPEASEISAFATPDDFLQYTVMAFGFKNAPATFQRLINTVVGDVPSCSAYLDDLVAFSPDWMSHLQTLRTLFLRLEEASLTLNLAKCEFAQATVTYLGKQVGRGEVRPLDAKVTAIVNFPVPTTRRELRRFLGMVGYYRTFCRNFSTVAEPLTKLLSPSASFHWSSECDHAFNSVKVLLSSAPVLTAPDFSRPFKVEVDASAVGAGAVLLQEDDSGIDHPVCYYSHKFNKHQLNYSTIEKEALALLLALQHFDVYVGSTNRPVTVYTDHNPLVFLSRMYNHNQRLMRWALFIQDYNLDIKHKKGKDNVLADALSRCS